MACVPVSACLCLCICVCVQAYIYAIVCGGQSTTFGSQLSLPPDWTGSPSFLPSCTLQAR